MPLPTETDVVPVVPMSNHVILFSNGMGYFRRVYAVPHGKETQISIPFKKEHLADAVESLTVRGRVKYTIPPSYTPTNAADTALVIDPGDVSASLLRSLSGSKFSYRLVMSGADGWKPATLMGIETIEETTREGTLIPQYYLSVISSGRVTRVLLGDIAEYRFDESGVQSEIDKAIQNNFQKIKPDSTFLNLVLASTSETEETALVSWKIPVAAWKILYNIRQDSKGIFLDIAAAVDNPTDETWDKTFISVVTGNPISFWSPDLAMVNEPVRQRVTIVESAAQGYVGVEEGVSARGGGGRMMKSAVARAYSSTSTLGYAGQKADFGMPEGALEFADAEMAQAPGMENKEVGDFCVFSSKEKVTIDAKQSAVVPVDTVALGSAGIILLYRESSHANRPFRALKFKNEATYDLGKGKVGVYKDDVFQGEAVLETAKPGENRTLPFCVDTGVSINKENLGTKDTLTVLRLTKGFGYEERRYVSTTEYTVNNKKDEAFKLMIEHTSVLPQANTPPAVTGAGWNLVVKEMEKIKDGYRLYLDLEPKAKLKIVTTETWVQETRTGIANNYNWVEQHVINPKHPLAQNEGVKKCLHLQKSIEKIDQDIADLKLEIESLKETSLSLQSNIQSTREEVGTAKTRTKWVQSLDQATDEVEDIKKNKIPALKNKKKDLTEQLNEALKSVAAEWTADT